MAQIVVIGGGVGGLTASLLLARDGHRVTVIERDPAPPPRSAIDAWDEWERRGVNQFRLPHLFLARFRQLLDAELPDVTAALEGAGALRLNPLPGYGVDPEAGDEALEMLTGRRPVIEASLSAVVADEPAVDVVRGVAVRALIADSASVPPRVTGVVTDDGVRRPADVVVDAGGRRSATPGLLAEAGLPVPADEAADCGFVYYGRHFRNSSAMPAIGPNLVAYDSVSVLTLPADNGHWSVTLTASARDADLRRAREPETWERIMRSYPAVEPWLDGEPITGIDVMAKIEDRVRRFAIDGEPIVTGLIALGDSWACTNPSIGRGASLALLHAVCLRDVLRDVGLDDHLDLARRWWAVTSEVVEPYVTDTLDFDRHRLAQIDAQIAGEAYEVDDPTWDIGQALRLAAPNHPDLARAVLAIAMMVERGAEAMSKPGRFDTLMATPPSEFPGPSRAELMQIVAA
jgi:2-polyprenyl-6-methoxyphenol hydroxylase-like FAD-dependent oxidoreductase